MFTFGIFSTHIPYIAFVVFYAYFLITGVEKASKGEIQSGAQTFATGQLAANHIDLNDRSGNFYYANLEFDLYAYFETFAFKRKIKHSIIPSDLNYQSDFHIPFSNRPPPFFRT